MSPGRAWRSASSTCCRSCLSPGAPSRPAMARSCSRRLFWPRSSRTTTTTRRPSRCGTHWCASPFSPSCCTSCGWCATSSPGSKGRPGSTSSPASPTCAPFATPAAREIERSRALSPRALACLYRHRRLQGHQRPLGHDAGDRTLIALATLALATARSVDTVARIGGDEFVIVMPETGADAALPLVTRLRESFPRVSTIGDAGTDLQHRPGVVRTGARHGRRDARRRRRPHVSGQGGGQGPRASRPARADPSHSAPGRLLPFSPQQPSA